MAFTTVLAIYFIIWWVVLFMVLPWGAHSQHDTGEVTPGTDPGAPAVHTVWRKLFWTTVIASILFGILAAVYELDLIPYDVLWAISGPPQH
jgi:predicted secreted protein